MMNKLHFGYTVSSPKAAAALGVISVVFSNHRPSMTFPPWEINYESESFATILLDFEDAPL